MLAAGHGAGKTRVAPSPFQRECPSVSDETPDDRRLFVRLGAPISPRQKRPAAQRIDEFVTDARAVEGGEAMARLVESKPTVRAVLEGVAWASTYLTDLLLKDPVRGARVLKSDPLEHIDAIIADTRALKPSSEAELMRALRLAKAEVALTLGLADLGQVLSVDAVTDALSRFADGALQAAIRFALSEEAARGRIAPADPEAAEIGSGYIVLAMGKYGAFELNYSSDIDLIVFYDLSAAPVEDRDTAQAFFVKVTKRIVKIMQERTPDGYVFRTDLRLRPDPGITPIALSVDAALQYYESLGQNWERAAMIKARACAGDIPAGERFLKEIVPFIWRKYFDFAAIQDVHSIKRQIHAHRGHGEIAVAGHNVKLGRGGIREIEFFVQTQQLIAGGRAPGLRGRQTIDMLDRLAKAGWIEPKVRDELTEAYRYLRQVEHRIQMVADEQTHSLPEDDAGLDRIARMMGASGHKTFATQLLKRLTTVQRHYARLFENAPELSKDAGNLVFTGDDDDPGTLETLTRLGYKNPKAVTEAVRAWHFGRYPAIRSAAARERLTEITPALIDALAATRNADAAFSAMDDVVRKLPGGFQLFAMLQANPHLLRLMTDILGTAPKLTEALVQRVHSLDSVLDPAFYGTLPTRAHLAERLDSFLREARLYEDILDRARIFGQEQRFLIGVRVLTGTLSAGQAGVAYATLAELLVDRLFEATVQEMIRLNGAVDGGRAAVVAMGKLGGREMTAASDLDLMLLYDAPDGVDASSGERPLMLSTYYTRLTQRLIAAISAPTAEGRLYDVDFRLRPSGNKGPVATRLAGFVDYQTTEAWTWEHMALTRARVIAGDESLARDVHDAILKVLVTARKPDKVRADVLEMRQTIEREKGGASRWDIKQARGGLVDVEFIAQYLMLVHGPKTPAVLASNTGIALHRLQEAGHLSAGDADILLPAFRLYNALTQVLRLAIDGAFDPRLAPGGLIELLLRAGEAPSLASLEVKLDEMQESVRAVFERVVGPMATAAT